MAYFPRSFYPATYFNIYFGATGVVEQDGGGGQHYGGGRGPTDREAHRFQKYLNRKKKKHPLGFPSLIAMQQQALREDRTVESVRAEWEQFYVMLAYFATEFVDE